MTVIEEMVGGRDERQTNAFLLIWLSPSEELLYLALAPLPLPPESEEKGKSVPEPILIKRLGDKRESGVGPFRS